MPGTATAPSRAPVRLDVRPLTPAIGAEIAGVDLARALDDATLAAIRAAFLDHLVLFFRDQDLSPSRLKEIAGHFGTLNVHDYVPGLPDHPEVLEIVKEPDDTGYNFGGVWHSDVTYLPAPALGSMLYAKEVPPVGGDTLFASMVRAYETLSEGMKRMLGGLRAMHSAGRSYGPRGRNAAVASGAASMRVNVADAAEDEVAHPVVRTHPETGRRALFVNANFTTRFEGMTREESAPLLEFLCAHLRRPELTCRLRWSAGALAFWDNRCTQHFAVNDYHGHRRRMHRVTIDGDVPV